MIVGQLTFGLFGDALGRHKIYGKELILTIFGTLLLIVAPTSLGHTGIVAWLTVFRIITGFGIGGGIYLDQTRVEKLYLHFVPRLSDDLLYLR
jgi:PHS family inorganic phosphate transporter-like MFS transporter